MYKEETPCGSQHSTRAGTERHSGMGKRTLTNQFLDRKRVSCLGSWTNLPGHVFVIQFVLPLEQVSFTLPDTSRTKWMLSHFQFDTFFGKQVTKLDHSYTWARSSFLEADKQDRPCQTSLPSHVLFSQACYTLSEQVYFSRMREQVHGNEVMQETIEMAD